MRKSILVITYLAAGIWAWTATPSSRIMNTGSSGPATEMKPYIETIPDTKASFEMVPISGGTFIMGSPDTEVGRSEDEGPQHKVEILPFWMGKTEVRWEEYDWFAFSRKLPQAQRDDDLDNVGQPDAISRPTPPYSDETFGYGRGDLPTISIGHHAAMEYTRWLSSKTGKTYRLPTEAEWEYACRAGTKAAYHFGDDPSILGKYAWFKGNSNSQPQKVGTKKMNPWGLHDMHGNVAEWVLDVYDKHFYKKFNLKTTLLSPVLIPTNEKYSHPVRGGSWNDKPQMHRSAARRFSNDNWNMRDPQLPQSIWWHTEAIFVGFRVVRPFKEQKNLRGLRSKVKKFDW